MRGYIEQRVMQVAGYILETGATVRDAARQFGVSKSTIHKDVCDRLQRLNLQLYRQVRVVLEKNKAERHLRGGKATHRKYKAAQG